VVDIISEKKLRNELDQLFEKHRKQTEELMNKYKGKYESLGLDGPEDYQIEMKKLQEKHYNEFDEFRKKAINLGFGSMTV